MPYRRWNPGCPCCSNIVTISTASCVNSTFITDLRYSSDSFAVELYKLLPSICRVIIAGGVGNAVDINGTYDLPCIGVGDPSFPFVNWLLYVDGDFPTEVWGLFVSHRYYHSDTDPRYHTQISRSFTGGSSDLIDDTYKCLEDQNNHVIIHYGSAVPHSDIDNLRMTISEIIIP